MKITLQDIAEDTGYSVSTVSRVLNGSDKISSKAREEILESAKRFRYLTPKARNAHTSTKVLNIALVASGFHEGEFYVSFFHGLNKAAARNNIRLFLAGVLDPHEGFIELMKEITFSYYDGAILFIPEFTRLDYEEVGQAIPAKFPVISNALIENPVFSTITFDSYTGGHLVATHFEERGYRRLGVIKGSVERAESRFRYNGFTDYVLRKPDLDLVWNYSGDFTFESGYEAFKKFEASPDKPRAIFACNDDMCNGFMEAAIKKGYSFPDDIAIIGYDDLPVCRHNKPTMSSVKTDYEQLGMETMKRMREKLSNPDLKTGMLSFVPVSIVQRESS